MSIRRRFLTLVIAVAAVFAWGAAPQAMTLEDIAELCRAGYTFDEIAEIVETLGLDEPIDSDALVFLAEEGCDRDLGIWLMREFGDEYGRGYDDGYHDDYYDPHTNIYIYGGWNWGYYDPWSSWSVGWHTPWWGISYSYYDPWYWWGWRAPRYHWTGWYHNWYYWDHHRYYWPHDYRHRYAHYKSTKTTRQRSRVHSAVTGSPKSYRATVSDSRVKRAVRDYSYKTTVRSHSKTTKSPYSRSTYTRLKGDRSSSDSRAVKKTTRGTSSHKSYRKSTGSSSRGRSYEPKSSTSTKKRSTTTTRSRSTTTVKKKSGSSQSSGTSGGSYRRSSGSSSSGSAKSGSSRSRSGSSSSGSKGRRR